MSSSTKRRIKETKKVSFLCYNLSGDLMTTIYITRHSQPFRKLLGEYNVNEIEQIRNEKNPLSVEGEKRALALSEYPELEGIDVLYSSHYVRAMSTAKYIAEHNNILLNVEERLGERKFGVKSMDELPETFFEDQMNDWDYKLPDGESLNEVAERTQEVILEILHKNKDKKIAIVSHGTALSVMLSKWCDIKVNYETKLIEIYFNNNLVFAGKWECPELFKLEFENDKLISIENIRK